MPRVLSDTDVSDFRERLCAKAAQLFVEKGIHGVTIRELASALGVSAMTPYRYFRDKDDILAAVRARAFDRFAEALENAYAQGSNSAEHSHAVGLAYVQFALEESASYRLMFDLSQPSEGQYPDLVRAAERARATMTSHVRQLVADKVLVGDPELIGTVFWVALHGAVTLQLAGKLSPQFKRTTQYGIDNIVSEMMTALGEWFRFKH